MEKKHIITLTGKPGSGKSSTSDRVAEMLGYTRYSSGDYVRGFIKKLGMTLAEFNEQAANDFSFDEEIDKQLRSLRSQRDIVIDARLGFYWIPESFKVYLTLDSDVASARIFRDSTTNDNRIHGAGSAESIGDVDDLVRSRMRSERERFKKLYKVDPYDQNNFDLIIDTSRNNPQTVALAVFDNYRKWLKTDVWQTVLEKVPIGYSVQ